MEASCSGRHSANHAPTHQAPAAFPCRAAGLPAPRRPAQLLVSTSRAADLRSAVLSASHRDAGGTRLHAIPAIGEVGDVEEVAGVRVVMDEDSKPVVEYLVKWKVRPRPAL